MIDIERERLISLADAAKSLPGRPHVATLWRWHARGVRGIRLETCVVGGYRLTSREALQRFSERLTAARDGKAARPSTGRQREKAIAQAEREFAAPL